MELLGYVLLAFFAGLIVKAVDWLEDDRKSSHPVKYLLAAVYGLIIGYIIGTATFSVLFLAALLAQVFARKIDTRSHELGFLVAVLSLFFFGIPSIDFTLLAVFLVLAFLDEADFIGPLRPLVEYRPFLPLGALFFALGGRVDFFLGIIAFDIGYRLFGVLGSSIAIRPAKGKK